MTATSGELPGWKTNVAVLVTLQAMTTTNAVALATVNGLAGLAIAPDAELATLPVTSFVLGGALSTFGASLWMGRVGRRGGFVTGIVCALLGASLCAYAAHARLFWLLCAGSAVLGIYGAFGQYYRFAAADVAPEALRHRAISWVLAGGIVGAVVGPESMKWMKDATGVPFVGSYLSLAALGVLALAVVSRLRVPAPPRDAHGEQRPRVGDLVRRPQVSLAIASAVVGYAVMSFLMTATPLAMKHHAHPFDDTAFVIEWHVLGMFAPSFVTGSLIERFGVIRVISTGALMTIGCAAVNFTGTTLPHFWIALVLLGVGWNFMFVGGTALLSDACQEHEKALAQGLNEVLVYAANTLASLTAGVLLFRVGWQEMNRWSLPFPIAILIGAVVVARLASAPGARAPSRPQAG